MIGRPVILVVGGSGQIGYELVRELAALGTVAVPMRRELDLLAPESVHDVLDLIRPTIVVNAAAYTLVDRAEREPALCARLNADAPAVLAAECKELDALLVHFSSDYVFDGAKRAPYVETDEAAPLNVYGQTKLAGERAAAAALGACLIFRTGWVYGARGRNFALTTLRLSRELDELAVVDDQVGAPTSAGAVARGVSQVLRVLIREPDFMAACRAAAGVYHMTAAGATTWYEFARVILADDPHAEEQICRSIRPIASTARPGAARRPSYSVLDNGKLEARFGVQLPPWPEQWRGVLEQLSARSASSEGAAAPPPDRPRA